MVEPSTLNCDVAVVGAGPAGAAAAIVCARRGLKTVLIGPRTTIKPLRPLESLNPLVRIRLEALNAAHALEAASLASFTCIWIDGVRQPLGVHDEAVGHHVDRAMFDFALTEAASEAGVFRLITSVRALTAESQPRLSCADGREVRARWTIDATGRARRLARLLGIGYESWSPPLVSWTGILPCAAGARHAARTSFDGDEQLWTWRTSRAGPGRTWTAVCRKGLPSGRLDTLRKQSLPGTVRGRRVDWELARACVAQRTMLVGDAAGTLDPATGQGVLNALTSGIAAAGTIVACLVDGGDPTMLGAAYDDWFVGGLRDGADQLDTLYQARGIRWHLDPLRSLM